MAPRFCRSLSLCIALSLAAASGVHGQAANDTAPARLDLSIQTLEDKIKGGWAGQTIGVTFGGPTEFRYNGTMIQDYVPVSWHEGSMKWWYENAPGLYDDIYMDLTFVDVLERSGLDAPAAVFAAAFAGADYQLWHANQQARYNILNGLTPPASGHWRNNPEADDIDFQIESDFAGLMSPGLPQSASQVCDRVGHIMNSGDGFYGGVYMANMYALAFTSADVRYVVAEALKAIPEESTFHQTITDVIRWHRQYPDDWKRTWFEIERKWSSDVGCPEGVYRPFNIDAKVNAAYVVLGLLYGNGDFTRTLEVATRAGQDSDCNPSSAAGILGTMLGYSNIPAYWKQGLAAVEPLDFKYTTISLNDVYGLSLRHPLEMIRRNGGTVSAASVSIPVQPVRAVPLEQNFVGHHPVRTVDLGTVEGEMSFAFDGIGFAVHGYAESRDGKDHVLTAELYVDDRPAETILLPTAENRRRYVPFWRYEMPDKEHTIRIRLVNPDPNAALHLGRVIIYDDEPRLAHHP